ncbi:hypothetical protein LIA77_09305 [Sarocladium implicatum]|nr:hypothetical protein LIA77_09305 [Sarocladium implicatum]
MQLATGCRAGIAASCWCAPLRTPTPETQSLQQSPIQLVTFGCVRAWHTGPTAKASHAFRNGAGLGQVDKDQDRERKKRSGVCPCREPLPSAWAFWGSSGLCLPLSWTAQAYSMPTKPDTPDGLISIICMQMHDATPPRGPPRRGHGLRTVPIPNDGGRVKVR